MSKNDSKKEGHFVRPESDGIRNGVPLGGDRNKRAESFDLTSDGLNQPIRKAIVKEQGDLPPSFIGGDLLRTSGVSIKTKLIASLSVLTLLIIVIGFIAISSILEINAVSVNIADRQGALAKYTEEVKVSLFRA